MGVLWICVGAALAVATIVGGIVFGVKLEGYCYLVNWAAGDDPWLQLKLILVGILVCGLVAAGLFGLTVFIVGMI